jgi:hypothetical protein
MLHMNSYVQTDQTVQPVGGIQCPILHKHDTFLLVRVTPDVTG